MVSRVMLVLSLVFRDSYRILGLGGETQHLGGSGSMFPQDIFLKTNVLRLILGHFLVHMHILAKCKNCKNIRILL